MIRKVLPSPKAYGLCLWLCFAVCDLFAQGGSAPVIFANGIVNNASYAPGSNALAPGSIVAIFGTDLTDGSSCLPPACNPTIGEDGRLGATMAGAQVTVNGTPVPIFYATPSQLGIQLPTDLSGTSATIQVIVGGQLSIPQTVSVEPFSPGIFSADASGSGQGAILNGLEVNQGVSSLAAAGSFLNARPARPGEVVVIFCTGLGQVTPSIPTGALPTLHHTVTPPTVTIDGLPATVEFSGMAPNFAGLYQVNVRIPAAARSGDNSPVVLSIGGMQSNTVTIAVAASTGTGINLSGSWQGTWSSILGVGGFIIASITQTGSVLSGTVAIGSSPCFSNGTFSGSFVGTTVVLNSVFASDQRVNFSGTVNTAGTSMSGTYVAVGGFCDGDSGTWGATSVN